MTSAVTCPICQQSLPPLAPGTDGYLADANCPHCGVALARATYPRLARATDPAVAERGRGQLAQEGEAVCRFYPQLQAETVCDECGCFLSRKAAVQWGDRTICLPCLHLLREGGKGGDHFSTRRRHPDHVALALVIFLLPLSLFTGPFALVYLLRHRKAPLGLVPRSRFRWWLALALATAATVAWLFLIVTWIAVIVRSATS